MSGGAIDGIEEFAAWYLAEHAAVVTVLCAVAGDPELARRATDEAFCRCYGRWESVRAMACPTRWTYRVALEALRRAGRRQHLERLLWNAEHRRAGAPVALDPPYQQVTAMLDPLSPRQRSAMVLRLVADLPEADIAWVMGLRRATVASTLRDGRRRLASCLDEPAYLEGGGDG